MAAARVGNAVTADTIATQWEQIGYSTEAGLGDVTTGNGWCTGGFEGAAADDIFMLRGRERDGQVRCAGDNCGARLFSRGS